jgi:hypothetical protein
MACLRDLASMSVRGIEERSDVQIAVSLEEGRFRPTTAPDTWNRWCREDHRDFGDREFGHCWVRVGSVVIDVTSAQFGEPALLVVPVGDYRYIEGRRSPW